MVLKCYNKPNRTRTRHFTAKDCGRVVCSALENGANKQDVFREVQKCLGDVCEYERIRLFVDLVLNAAAAITIGLAFVRAFAIAARFALVAFRRIPLIGALVSRANRSILALEDAAKSARDITNEAQLLKVTILRK